MRAHRYDDEANKARTVAGLRGWSEARSGVPHYRKRLATDRAFLAEQVGREFAVHGWVRALKIGRDVPNPRMLSTLRSPAAIYMLVVIADHLLHLSTNTDRVDRRAAKFSNDEADRHYVSVALLGEYELRAEDKRLNIVLELCRAGLDAFRGFAEYPTRAQIQPFVDLPDYPSHDPGPNG